VSDKPKTLAEIMRDKYPPMIGDIHKTEVSPADMVIGGFPGIYEARFSLMPRIPKPPKQRIPMPKMSPKKVLEAVRTTLAPFTLQGIIHGVNEVSEKAKEGVNEVISKITYPEEMINETVKRKLYKY